MPSTNNPQHNGELAKFYYIIGDTDLSQADATVLGLTWLPFCIVDLNWTASKNMRQIADRCNPTFVVSSPGRKDVSLSFSLNQFRWPESELKELTLAIDDGDIISILAFNSDIADTEAWGLVGNYVCSENSEDQPADGVITESYTMVPAADSTSSPVVRRIYGSTADVP